jgi:Uma2 family endonuclease
VAAAGGSTPILISSSSCGEPRFADDHRDILINPSVIIEVLSPTTEAF